MRLIRQSAVAAILSSLVLSGMGAAPAAAAPGVITCTIRTPGNPVVTSQDVPVAGRVICVNSVTAQPVTLAVVPYKADVSGPFSGKLAFNTKQGTFTYSPGWYPPDPVTKKTDRLPKFSGTDSFLVAAASPDGARTTFRVPIVIQAPPRRCNPSFVPSTRTMFNDPSGSEKKQYQMLDYLIDMIDCTPAKNPDGTQASIRTSFYSMTYAPMQAALVAAAKRGVSIQALTNSHADKYPAWQTLAAALGENTYATNFAATCWQGCLTPRTPPVAGGPTAWFSADATSLTSKTVVFSSRAIAGTSPIVKYAYDFGDGTKATGAGPHKKTYKKLGTYTVTLTVTDAAGRSHTVRGKKTLPDNLEPEYPSLHSKVYLFSTVGTGKSQRQWVSGYSSGNPTYQQSRKGFNNLNIAVGDAGLYKIFANYFTDLTKGSRGQLMTPNYFRTLSTPGNAATGARPTLVHLGPQTNGGDINRDIIKSIQCKYKSGGKVRRTDVRVSIFVFTRKGVAADLWNLAMRKGCNVEIVYTQMSQRVRGANGRWLTDEDGHVQGWGVADCLSTKPTRVKVVRASKGKPAKRKVVANSVYGTSGVLCSGGSLKGKIPVSSNGVWLNQKSKYGGGRLKVRMACPVAPKYNAVTKSWSVLCIRNDIFTHHKVMMVKGMIRGKAQKYVMSGSANWSSPGLRSSDEVITEIQNAGALYDQYRSNYEYLKSVVAKNSKKTKKKKKTAKTYVLALSDDQVLDVRGMTDAQLANLED